MLCFAIAEHHFVLTTEQRIGAGEIEVIDVHFLRADHVRRVSNHATAVCVGETFAAIINLAVDIALAVGVGRFQVPASSQCLIKGGEGGFILEWPRAPGSRHIGRATQPGLAAVGVPVGYGAPGRTLHLFVLIVITHGEHGGIGQVGLKNPVADFPLQRVLVAKRLAVAVSQHRTPA